MSVLWSYLLRNYCKVLALAVLTFIAVLVVSRFQTVAHFAALGAPLSKIALFLLYQVPYVLPYALPLSSLLSAMLLFISLSKKRELTALRAAGFSIGQIFAPLLVASALLFCFTFYLTSEVATSAHLKTRKMAYDFTALNPLVLLQNARIAKLQGAYIEMEPVKAGEEVRHVAVAGKAHDHLFLYLIRNLKLHNGELKGRNLSLISSLEEHLAIENQKEMHTEGGDLAFLLRPKGWKIANDHLSFPLLRARQAHLRMQRGEKAEKNLTKSRSEVARRFFVSLSAFTFTLLGGALGISISRRPRKRGVILAAALSALSLLAFFTAHELDHRFTLSLLLLIVPHLAIAATAIGALVRIQRGQT